MTCLKIALQIIFLTTKYNSIVSHFWTDNHDFNHSNSIILLWEL